MSDTNTVENTVENSAPKYAVPVVKSGSAKLTVEVDSALIPDNYYAEALKLGLKTIVNGGATKISKETYPEDADRFEAARALAAARVQEMYEGKLKLGTRSGPTSKVAANVMTEARRLAREIVKQTLKDQGLKVSHYSASAITAAANDLIAADPELLTQAEENLAKRGKLKDSAGNKVTTAMAGLAPDPKLVAKAESEAAAKKSNAVPLSAKQAGMTKPHHSAAH